MDFLKRVRRFVRENLDPISPRVERSDRVPWEAIRSMARLGLTGAGVPQSYGGVGLSVLECCLVAEEMGWTNHCFLRMLGWGLIDNLLEGTEEQKKKYLIPLIAGDKISAYALSEPHAGSDASKISATAFRRKGFYILNGRKTMVSRGDLAEIFIIFAVTDLKRRARGGITAFIVERGFPGFRQGKIQEKMGLRGMGLCEILLEDCRVPEENVLGKAGQGFKLAMRGLDAARLKIVAAPAVGQAQRLLEMSIAYARERRQFGGPIAEKQAIQFMLANMAVDVYAARVMVYDAARRAEQGLSVSRETAMAKLFASEMACRAADSALQIHGGVGYLKNHFVEIAYRDARLGRIWEGTSEIQRIVISRALMKDGK